MKIVQDIILAIEIDDKQKNLYLESLNMIDSEGLDNLYSQLSALINILEENKALQLYKNKDQRILSKETTEKQKEINSLQFLLDNV